MKKLVPNEKIDLLSATVSLLIGIIIFLVLNFYCPQLKFLSFIMLLFCILPNSRRRLQISRIQQMAIGLNLTLADVRMLAELDPYAVTDWNFSGSFVSIHKIYLLEYLLEKEYHLHFGEEFVYQKPRKKITKSLM